MAKKFYAVKKGRTPGIYTDWDSCKAQVMGFAGAIYKGFETKSEAEAFLRDQTSSSSSLSKTTAGIQNNGNDAGSDIDTAVKELPQGDAIAYVDGSFDVSAGRFSCGAILFANTGVLRTFYIGRGSSDPDLITMRNVAGEIMGSMEAMKLSQQLGIKRLTIFHDYEGIARWCLGDWKTNKEGTKAYKAFYDEISNELDIKFIKVKGHSGDKYNDLADELAKKALRSEPFCDEV